MQIKAKWRAGRDRSKVTAIQGRNYGTVITNRADNQQSAPQNEHCSSERRHKGKREENTITQYIITQNINNQSLRETAAHHRCTRRHHRQHPAIVHRFKTLDYLKGCSVIFYIIAEAVVITLSMHCIIRYSAQRAYCASSPNPRREKKQHKLASEKENRLLRTSRSRTNYLCGLSSFFFFFFISVILCSFCACYNLAPVLFISQLYSITLQMSWSASPAVSPRRGRVNADTGRN